MAQDMNTRMELCNKLMPNNWETGISYSTLSRWLGHNHHLLTLPANIKAIREHLKIPNEISVLEYMQRGSWVDYKEQEVAA